MLLIITAKEITKVLGIDCCSHVLRSVQSMIQFIAVNDLVVCSITTVVKQLESKDSVFAPYELLFVHLQRAILLLTGPDTGRSVELRY